MRSAGMTTADQMQEQVDQNLRHSHPAHSSWWWSSLQASGSQGSQDGENQMDGEN
ncbi:hypothetical protein SynRS9909_01030 [Synechococcus sp. RS9909]|nr:hypothetical protein SynRS9909_01030 [Synechococcus sp. RS9909]